MTESEKPQEALTDAEAVALGRNTLRKILAGEGTKEKPLNLKCEHCGRFTPTTVKGIDTGEIVKVTEYFDKIAKAGSDDTPKKARALLDQIRDMSDEELAQEFFVQ